MRKMAGQRLFHDTNLPMHLGKEYCQRHSINVPLVKHTQKDGTIFLRDDSNLGVEWLILSFSFRGNPYHPGTYKFLNIRPIHNGYSEKLLFEIIDEDILEWDEYEDYILDFSKTTKTSKVVTDRTEIVLAAWEMFVYCHDRSLSQFADILFPSFDTELSATDRYAAYQLASNYFFENKFDFYKSWKRDMISYIKSYSHWLAEIVQEYES